MYLSPSLIYRTKNLTRESVIYEEMKLSCHPSSVEPVTSPPPLPPRHRKRLDTDCSNLHRSYTSPESDYLVNKKKWNLFDNMFGKGSKKSPVESRKKRNGEKLPPQPRELQLLKTKRNSFSSPDLTHFYCPNAGGADGSFNNSGCENCSFDQSNISSSNSYELENVCEEEDDLSEAIENVINISQQIRSNFEPHANNDMSRVNLVGAGFNLNDSNASSVAMSPPGYLEMRPGKGFDMKRVSELDQQMIQNDILYRLKYSFDSPITYKREFDYDSPSPMRTTKSQPTPPPTKESHYVPMNVGTKFSPKSSQLSSSVEEHTYVPMNRCTIPATSLRKHSFPSLTPSRAPSSSSVQTNTSICNGGSTTLSPCERSSSCSTTSDNSNKRNSIDDKIASYYPNYDVPARLRSTPHVRSRTAEGVIIGRKSKTPEPAVVREKSGAVQIPLRKAKRFGSFNTKSSCSSLNDNNNNNNHNDKEISRKYATIARITSPNSKFNTSAGSSDEDLMKLNLTTASNIGGKKSGSVSPNSIKRFASFSKLKKLDFSPLRLKITSVLQRHNSGSC